MDKVKRLLIYGLLVFGLFHFGYLPIDGSGGGIRPPFSQKIELRDAWFVVIEETDHRPQFVSTLKTDMALWEEVAKAGARYRFYDVDGEDAASYRDRARSIGLPAYFLVNGDGTLVSSGPLPQDHAGVLKVVRQE